MMFVRALALLLALSGSALAQSGQIPTGTVWGNSTASKAIASPATFTAMFDRAFGSTTGAVIARSGAAWGLVSGTTTQLLHGNAAGSPSFGQLVAADVTTNTLTNATLAQAAAWTLKGNATASTANVADFTVTGLTSKATPVGADEFLLSDSAASNAFKKTTVTAVATAVAPTVLAGAVTSVNGQSGALLVAGHPQGRLTLQSGTPVMTSTQSAKTTLIYTQYAGNQVPIYNGTNTVLEVITGGEISVATTDATKSPAAIGASKVNDWFVWNDAGTIRLGHGPDWTSDTARSAGTALVYATGVLVNSVAITNGPAQFKGTYVGTTRSNASSQLDWIIGGSASGGTAGVLGVWNMYNRVQAYATSIDNGVQYTYTSGTIRQSRASAGNQVSFVTGLAEDAVHATGSLRQANVGASNAFIAGSLGLDSTTTTAAGSAQAFVLAGIIQQVQFSASFTSFFPPQLGYHFIARLENGDGANANIANVGQTDFLSTALRM